MDYVELLVTYDLDTYQLAYKNISLPTTIFSQFGNFECCFYASLVIHMCNAVKLWCSLPFLQKLFSTNRSFMVYMGNERPKWALRRLNGP